MSGPFSAAELGLPESVPCAFCGSERTELHSPFGSQLSLATYWCRACRTPFEWFRWGGPPTGQATGTLEDLAGPTDARIRKK